MKNITENSTKENEIALLGSMILSSDCIEEVCLILTSEDFYLDDSKKLFNAIITLNETGAAIDPVTIKTISGLSTKFLSDVISSVPVSTNFKTYAENVKQQSIRRKLKLVAANIDSKVAGDVDTKDIVKYIEEQIVEATLDTTQKEAISLSDGISNVLEHIDMLRNDPKDTSGIKTGIEALDKKINGLNKTDLLILAARPGCGKSSFALQIAKHTSFNEDAVTMFFSLEMGTEQLVQRTLCHDSKVDLWKIRSGKMDELEMQALRQSARKLQNSPLFFNDMAGVGIKDIRSQIKLHNAKNDRKVEFVVVDYLQLMASGSQNLVQQVTEISRGLKIIAKEFNIPVLALSQLSRAVEARGGKPRLSDLRDSGSIEQDADIVMFLHREKNEDNFVGIDNVDLLIEKHRNGSTGEIKLDFNGGKMTFTEGFVL